MFKARWQDELLVLQAMERLGGGRTAEEIASEARLGSIRVAQTLRSLEAAIPAPVRFAIEHGRAGKVWYLAEPPLAA